MLAPEVLHRVVTMDKKSLGILLKRLQQQEAQEWAMQRQRRLYLREKRKADKARARKSKHLAREWDLAIQAAAEAGVRRRRRDEANEKAQEKLGRQLIRKGKCHGRLRFIYRCVRDGRTYRDIADLLGISTQAVGQALQKYRKLGLTSAYQTHDTYQDYLQQLELMERETIDDQSF